MFAIKRDCRVSQTWLKLNEGVRVANREAMKDRGVEEMEHRKRRSQAKPEYSDRAETEPGRTLQNANGVSDILTKLFGEQEDFPHTAYYDQRLF